ncbi:MAG: hypothetical protein SFV53_01080 [Rickettsiales bacterium]|nr:hypothetical protein [Rickettsiales bacterium]
MSKRDNPEIDSSNNSNNRRQRQRSNSQQSQTAQNQPDQNQVPNNNLNQTVQLPRRTAETELQRARQQVLIAQHLFLGGITSEELEEAEEGRKINVIPQEQNPDNRQGLVILPARTPVNTNVIPNYEEQEANPSTTINPTNNQNLSGNNQNNQNQGNNR